MDFVKHLLHMHSFESNGRRIDIDRLEPPAAGPGPGMLVLHGSMGMAS